MTQEIKQRIKQLRLNKTPDGYKKTAVGVIPQEWKVVRFKELFSRLTRRNTEHNKNVLTISAQYGLISQEEFFNKTVASENTENYFLLNKGDFAYNKSYSNGYPYGAIKSLTKYNKGIVSPLYICFFVTEENKFPEFYNQYFEAGKFNREINAYAQEGARNHGLLNIAVEDFFNSLLIKPPLAEQQKIAEILSTQDKVIELQQKRIDELKKLKKAYLSKMFPQKGSNVPELRFKGFTGDWEQRKVGELADSTYGGGTPNTSNTEYWNGDIPWIQSSDITEHQLYGIEPKKNITAIGLSKSATKLIPANSIAIVTRVGVGKLAVMPFEYTTSQDFLSLGNLKIDVDFGAYLLYRKMQSELNAVQGTSIKGVTKDELLKKNVLVPSKAEQQKIGSFFRNLDRLITLQSRKLDAEKLKKKSLMQLLLTGIVRVK